MKVLVFALMMTMSTFAFAKDFVCRGLTTYGSTVTVWGSYDPDYSEMISNLNVKASDDPGSNSCPSFKGCAPRTHYFGPEDVTLKSREDSITINAKWNQATLVIRAPAYSEGNVYMSISLSEDFDHEFLKATCEFSAY